MPQTFVALRCAFCNTFQGQLDKKSKKFTCVICNAKQSFRTIFAVSNSGKDIRVTVQQLNEFRGAQDELKGSEQAEQLQQQVLQQQQQSSQAAASAPTHTWQEFAAEGADGPEDDAAGDESGFVTAVPDVQLGKRQQGTAAAGSGGTQQAYNKRFKQHQQGGDGSSATLPGRMQQHSTAPGKAARYGQPHAAVASHQGQLAPQWQQPRDGAQGSCQGPSTCQPLQRLPQQGQHAKQPHFQQQPQQQRGKAGTSSGSWQSSQGNETNTAQQPWYMQQQQQRQQQQVSSVPWPPQQHQQGIATAGAQAGAPATQSTVLGGPSQHSSNQQPPGQQAQKQPGPQASWQQQQQQGPAWLPKQQQMQQAWQPKGQQQWQAQQQREQQQAWQQPPRQARPAQRQLTSIPGASRQAGPNRPPQPPQGAAAAKGGRAPGPAAASAWSAFVDDFDQAAGEGSDDDDGGMCFVTDADVAVQWT